VTRLGPFQEIRRGHAEREKKGRRFPLSNWLVDLVVGSGLLLLLDEPVLNNSGLAGIKTLLALNLDGHGLVLLQAGSQISLLGGEGSLGQVEGGDLAGGIGLLDGGGLVGLELLEVELLDEIGYRFKASASEL